MRFDAWDVLGEPLAVTDRDELVLFTLPVQHGDADRGHLESPRLSQRHVVVEPAVHSSLDAGERVREHERRDSAVQHFAVRWTEERLEYPEKLLRRRREQLLTLPLEDGKVRFFAL